MRGLKIIDRSSTLLSLSFLREKGVGEELNQISIFMMDIETCCPGGLMVGLRIC